MALTHFSGIAAKDQIAMGPAGSEQPLANGILNASAVYDPPSLATNTQATTPVTATGAALGDFVLVSFSLDLQGIVIKGYVSAANTVTVVFLNNTAGTLDLASGTLFVRVLKK